MFSKIIQRKLLFISSIILDKIDKKRDYYINDLHDFIFSNEGKLLNLSACKKRISVSYPITNNGTLNLDKGKYLSQIQVDIFNISDKFFYDCCYNYTEENGDLPVLGRRVILYQNASLCPDNCIYSGINYEYLTSSCECPIKKEFEPEEEQKITSFKQFPEYLFHMINLYIIICIKRVSDKRNYGLYALLLVHVIQLLLNLYIYYCCFP